MTDEGGDALGLISNRKKDVTAAFDYFQRSYLVYITLGQKQGLKKSLTSVIAAADALDRKSDAETYRKALAALEQQ